jgi:DNA-binding NarL/FixJ family response regulator
MWGLEAGNESNPSLGGDHPNLPADAVAKDYSHESRDGISQHGVVTHNMEKHAHRKRVLVLDAQPVWLRAVEGILETAGFQTTLTSSPKQALALHRRGTYALMMVGIDFDGFDWQQFVETVRLQRPACKLIVVSEADRMQAVRRALKLGADAYVVKRAQPSDVVFAVRQALSSGVFHVAPDPRGSSGTRGRQPGGNALTPRELEILTLLAEGLSNAEIARTLGLKEPTVKGHLWRLYRKIGVRNRTGAASWAAGAKGSKTR